MKSLITNQKGNVLSVAFIVIALLSFAITATTVYSYNIATRTTDTIDSDNEEVFAREIIRQSFNDIRQFIDAQNFDAFPINDAFDTDFLIDTVDYYNNLSANYYLAEFGIVNDTPLTLEGFYDTQDDLTSNPLTRTYIARFELESGRVITRDLLITYKNPEFDSGFTFDNYDDVFQFLETELQEDKVECGTADCDINDLTTQNVINVVDGGGDSSSYKNISFEQNILVETQLDMTLNPGAGSDGIINLNGSVLYVKQNLTLNNISSLESDTTDRQTPGFILVEGDLTIVSKKNFNLENVIVIVKGNIAIDTTTMKDKDEISGSYFHILELDGSGQLIPNNGSDIPENKLANNIYYYCIDKNTNQRLEDSTTQTTCPNTQGDINRTTYYYVGTNEFFDVAVDLIDKYESVFGTHSDGSLNPFDFNFAESPYRDE